MSGKAIRVLSLFYFRKERIVICKKRIILLLIHRRELERKLVKLVMMSLFTLVKPVQRQRMIS